MVMIRKLPYLLILLCLSLQSCDNEEGDEPVVIHISAAASLAEAMTDITELYIEQKSIQFELNFASSSTCARQIEAGMPSHIFLSAHEKWIDYLEKHYIEGSKRAFLSNSLVVVAPLESELVVETPEDLLNVHRIAMGDPTHVPAGLYGKSALERAGLWTSLENKVVGAMDVRAALALASSGAVDCAVVYKSDALIDEAVKPIFEFSSLQSGDIEYFLCRFDNSEHVRNFVEFLQTGQARDIFSRYGFKGVL